MPKRGLSGCGNFFFLGDGRGGGVPSFYLLLEVGFLTRGYIRFFLVPEVILVALANTQTMVAHELHLLSHT